MKYYVIEGRNVGTIGHPKMEETIVYTTENKADAVRFEDGLRKTYKDRTMVDCWVTSDEEMQRISEKRKFYDSLTEEQKKDYIVVDGKKYIRAIYENNHSK